MYSEADCPALEKWSANAQIASPPPKCAATQGGEKGQAENITLLRVQNTDRKLPLVRKRQGNKFFIERRMSGCIFYNSFYVYQQARILSSLVIKFLKKAFGSGCHGNEWLKGQMFLEQPLRQMALSGSVPHDLICSFSFKYRGPLKSPSLKFTPT